MRLHHLRLTIRGAMAVVALLALVLALVLLPLIRVIERRKMADEFGRVASAQTNAIFALVNRVPPGVDPTDWKSAVESTAVAHFNAFQGWHRPPIEEVYRLNQDLMPKLRGSVGVQTLAWTWDRLASTGVDGKNYVDKYRPKFEKCFPPGMITGHATEDGR
jgi:hypothetical protein